jgi:hypothetical protein
MNKYVLGNKLLVAKSFVLANHHAEVLVFDVLEELPQAWHLSLSLA